MEFRTADVVRACEALAEILSRRYGVEIKATVTLKEECRKETKIVDG